MKNELLFFLSFAVSAFLAVPIYRGLIRMKARQTISQHLGETHQVKAGTPTMGGLIILAGFLACLPYIKSVSVAFLAISFAVIGFIDDFVVPRYMTGKRGLGWTQKLAMQLVASGTASYFFHGAQANFVTHAITIFVLLFFANAYNFSDGLDALAGSIAMVFLIGILFLSGDNTVIAVSLALAGSITTFLFLNAPPAKIFMGDVGSLPIGAILGWGVLSVGFPAQATPIGAQTLIALILLSFVMIVELVPVPIQILSVKLLKRKVFLKTPIHHSFEAKGWPETRILFTFVLVQVICVMAAMVVIGL